MLRNPVSLLYRCPLVRGAAGLVSYVRNLQRVQVEPWRGA